MNRMRAPSAGRSEIKTGVRVSALVFSLLVLLGCDPVRSGLCSDIVTDQDRFASEKLIREYRDENSGTGRAFFSTYVLLEIAKCGETIVATYKPDKFIFGSIARYEANLKSGEVNEAYLD